MNESTSQNHTPGSVHPSPPHCQRRSLYTSHHLQFLVGCLSFPHAIEAQSDRGLTQASVVQYICALMHRYCRIPEP
uniref:Uncharacterized protein n=1 Tax=Mesocestoides corti TaxID=53468 RepID=A0A5K3G058_MESCO